MQRIWTRYAPYWHICMALAGAAIAALFWFKDVSSYDGRITKLEVVQLRQEKKVTRIDYNIQLIADKLKLPYVRQETDE